MKRRILLGGLIVLGMMGFVCLLFKWPAYLEYKQCRDLERARRYLAAGDQANAALSARQVLQIDPTNIQASRCMASLAELARSPAVIDWNWRVAQLEPTLPNRLAVVAAILRWGRPPYSSAARILKEIEPEADQVPSFHVLSAELALKLKNLGVAAEQFRAASRLQPGNLLHRLNLSVLELQSSEPAAAIRARSQLRFLTTNSSVRPFALRVLVVDGLQRNDLVAAEQSSDRLLALPEANLEDRLQHLTVLQRLERTGDRDSSALNGFSGETSAEIPGRPGEFDRSLSLIQTSVKTNSAEVFAVCEWMGTRGLAPDALKWMAGLDPALLQTDPLRLAKANLYAAQADWTGLDQFLTAGKWTDLEFLRLALLARAAWGQGQSGLGDTRWHNAIRAASDRLGCLTLLLNLAGDWLRDPQEVLWQIGRRFPREDWALRALEQIYISHGNTLGLNHVYATLLEEKSTVKDITNRNDFACTSLLLGINLAQAHTLARELHAEHPNDVVIASTYAFSLYLQGRPAEGVKALARFSDQDLQQPQIALYYGVLLAKTGQVREAAPYLALVDKIRLSPEEKRLWDEALTQRRSDAETLRNERPGTGE
jgi:predicted Zn-dependent protease